jgi:sugar O-acyltransferase (sialic acid O-acetyltransferase NeuD family)
LTKAPILLIGAGGHAKSCIDVIELEGRFEVAGLIGLQKEVGSRVLGYPVLGTDATLPVMFGKFRAAFISIGQIETVEPRSRMFRLAQQNGCELPVIVSPLAHVSKHATLGAGTIVMHGAVVNAGAVVGRNCIINSHALVEHDATVADHCHIATAAVINGGVYVGEGTFVGSNSTVRQCVTIGDGCLIGMAQTVLADCDPGTSSPSLKRPT